MHFELYNSNNELVETTNDIKETLSMLNYMKCHDDSLYINIVEDGVSRKIYPLELPTDTKSSNCCKCGNWIVQKICCKVSQTYGLKYKYLATSLCDDYK